MKTPTRNASRLITILALVAATSLAGGYRAHPVAQYKEGEVSLGGTIDATYIGGEAKEHVFAPKSVSADYAREFGVPDDGQRHQLSRLDWDIAASMIGLTGAARYDRLSLNFGVWYGGSGSDGYDMEDYDWMEGDHVPHTEYSRSDTELTDAWLFDANVSCDLWRSEGFTGCAFAGAREQRWKWTCDGRNDFRYSENGHLWAHDHDHVVDYRQAVFFGYVGLGGTWRLSDALDLSAYASWAPGWKGRDRDNHIAAGKISHDSFDWGGDVYGAGVSLGWHLAERATVSLAVDWQEATLNQGDLHQWDYDEDERTDIKEGSGMENEYAAFTIALDYAF